MTIAFKPGVLRGRVLVPASRETIGELLATDAGRERFWAESSAPAGDQISLRISDGTVTKMEILQLNPPDSIGVRYFGALTTFTLVTVVGTHSLLEVIAHDVDHNQEIEVAAGWIAVLLCLKACLAAAVDFRNHDARYTWREGFVDN